MARMGRKSETKSECGMFGRRNEEGMEQRAKCMGMDQGVKLRGWLNLGGF